MAILTTFKHTGNPDEMLKLAEEGVRPAARQAGGEEGQISSTIVRTEDGIMLIHLWETEEGMRRAVGRFPPRHRSDPPTPGHLLFLAIGGLSHGERRADMMRHG